MYSRTTITNYRSQLRKLWEVWKIMPDDDERRPALFAQITRLCDKLGYEVNRLDVILVQVKSGRPRLNPDVSDLRTEVEKRKEDPLYWSPEMVDKRAKEKLAASARLLDEMQALVPDQAKAHKEVIDQNKLVGLAGLANDELTYGGDKDEGRDKATDDVGAPGTTDRSGT